MNTINIILISICIVLIFSYFIIRFLRNLGLSMTISLSCILVLMISTISFNLLLGSWAFIPIILSLAGLSIIGVFTEKD